MQRSVLIRAILVVVAILAIAWLWQSRSQQQAKITLVPPATISAGQTFEVPLRVTVPTAINAGEFYFSFPTDLLEVKEIKKDGSLIEIWIKDSPSFDNAQGTIGIAGGLPTPGFSGTGTVATIVFATKKAGQGQITLSEPTTRLLANDGAGSQVSAQFSPVRIRIR